MPVEFVDTFQPATQFGNQLSGFVRSLFAGRESPAERDARAALAADRQAQAGYHSAMRRKAEAEAMGLEDRNRALSGNLVEFASTVAGVPEPDVHDYLNWLHTGEETPVQMVPLPHAPGVTQVSTPDAPPMKFPKPQLTSGFKIPGDVNSRRIAEAIAAYRMAQMTRPNNPMEVSQTFGQGVERSRKDFIRAGSVDPATAARQEAAIEGKPLVGSGSGGQVFDLFTGAAGPENPVSASTVAQNVGQSLRNRYNESERGVVDTWQGSFTPHAGNVPGADVYTDMPVNGRTVPISRKDMSREAAQALFRAPTREPRGPRPPAPERMPSGELNQAGKVFAGALDQIEAERDGKIPTEIRARIQARAIDMVKDPNSEHFRNPASAFDSAVQELAPEWDLEGDWNPFADNVLKPKGGAPKAAAPAPAAPAPAAPPKKIARPQGMSDRQLIDEANKAVAAGKDRNAVMQRLRDMGVKVD